MYDTLEASKRKHPVDSGGTTYDMNRKRLSIICTMLPREVFVRFSRQTPALNTTENPNLRPVDKYVNQASGGTPHVMRF